MNSLPDKIYFKIGEVAEVVGVKTHVLRYWESEFKELRPVKTRGQHRMYSRRDIEVAETLRTLLHEQGFTIVGAKQKLKDMGFRKNAKVQSEPIQKITENLKYKTELLTVRKMLTSFLDEIEKNKNQKKVSKECHAVVHQVVPAKVKIQKNPNQF